MKRFNCSFNLNPTQFFSSLIVVMSLSIALAPAQARSLSSVTNSEGSASAAKEVVNKLLAEDFEGVRANFNQQMKDGLSAEKIKEVWEAALQYHGKYKSQSEPTRSQDQGYDVFVIRCEMQRSPMEVMVAYDQSGKIGGLWVRPAKPNQQIN
jgi:hypothetical protein